MWLVILKLDWHYSLIGITVITFKMRTVVDRMLEINCEIVTPTSCERYSFNHFQIHLLAPELELYRLGFVLVDRIEQSCIVSCYKAGEETAASPVPHPVEHEMLHAGIVNTSPPFSPTAQNTSYLASSQNKLIQVVCFLFVKKSTGRSWVVCEICSVCQLQCELGSESRN